MPVLRLSSALFRPAALPSSASAAPPLLPLDLSAPLDDAEREFLWRWRHMHRPNRGPIFAVETKRVSWGSTEVATQRFVWEVAQWRRGSRLVWVFLCWSIEAPVGVRWKDFPAEDTARRYFALSPAIVMAPSDPEGQAVPEP
jgi:hypothetical protein